MTDISDRAALDALADALRRHGYTIAPNGDEIEVRITFLIRIRVSVRDGALRCRTFFGIVDRSRTALLTTITMGVVTSTLLLSGGITPLALSVGFLGVMAGAYECLRFIVSEGALAQIHQRWSEVLRAPVRGELASGAEWMEAQRDVREPEVIQRTDHGRA